MSLSDIWFGVAAMLQLPPEVTTPTLRIYNPATSTAIALLGEGSPVDARAAREPVVLGGADPADFVLIAGDIVTFRSER